MARLINSKAEAVVHVKIQTLLEDGTTLERSVKVGDIVEGLRYVLDGEIAVVSGRVTAINYTLPGKISFNKNKPADTFATDVTIQSITIDCSDLYSAKTVTVPMIEVLEDEGVENVQRVKFEAFLEYKMKLYFSNYSIQETSLQVGDKVDNVKVMITPGNDIVGEFEIVAFGYVRKSTNEFTVNCIVLKNAEHGTIVADLDKILSLTEIITYQAADITATVAAIAEARDGETIELQDNISAEDTLIDVVGKDITLNLNGKTVTVGNANNNGILASDGGKITLKNGKAVSNQAYDSSHSSTAITARDGGELVIGDNFQLEAVLSDDPVNKGQFGVGVFGQSKLTIEDGAKITAGWYGISTNGNYQQDDNTEIVVNGGEICSTVDFAIYHPANATLTINGGFIHGGAGAISANAGRIIINGGILESSGEGDTGSWSDGTSGQTDAAINLNGKYNSVYCEINGGIIRTRGDAALIVAGTSHPVTIIIKGGQFSSKPDSSWIAPGYVCSEEKNANGYYEVTRA